MRFCRYRPKALEKLSYHPELSENLKALVGICGRGAKEREREREREREMGERERAESNRGSSFPVWF